MTRTAPSSVPNSGIGRRTLWWVRSIGSWVVLLAVLAVVGLTVALPTLAGGTAYTVLSPSMRPSLPPGALVVTRPVHSDDVAVGDVVTYQLRSGEAAVVTHRVTALRLTTDGQTLLQTKGDHNDTVDPDLVQPAQLQGRLWYSLPYLGYLNSTVASHGRVAIVGFVVVGLLGYAGWMFVSASRDRRRLATPATDSAEHAT